MLIHFLMLRGMRSGNAVRIRAWIAADDAATAERRASHDLGAQAVTQLVVESCEVTVRADYFRPCESLDAFERAERDGTAYIIAPA